MKRRTMLAVAASALALTMGFARLGGQWLAGRVSDKVFTKFGLLFSYWYYQFAVAWGFCQT